MSDHSETKLSGRGMIRAHAYPLLALISTVNLLVVAILLIPQAVRHHRYNLCIDEQMRLRRSSGPKGQDGPGKLFYLKAVEHCEGR
jgi:hypothetical protein